MGIGNTVAGTKMESIGVVAKVMAFLSDTVTVLVGCAALYGVFRHGKEIRAFMRLLATSHIA